MTPISLKRLEEMAKKATPGPWKYNRWTTNQTVSAPNTENIYSTNKCGIVICSSSTSRTEFNSRYIAAVSPDVILELISCIRKQREALERMVRSNAITIEAYKDEALKTLEDTKGVCE